MGTFPHVRVEGGPAERGIAYGQQAAERVARSIEAYAEVFRAYAGWDWARVREEAARYEEPIAARFPAYLEEIRGIARGAGVDVLDVLAINVRTEVMFAAKARAAQEAGRPPGCSAFAVLPGASGGRTLIGQNWDWLLHCFDTVVVLEARQEGGPDFVTVVEAGLLAKTGMNSSGIGLATNALVTDADRGEPGLPYHVLLRGILDAETLSDAYAVLQSGFRSSSANYLIAHRDGIAVDVEAAPGDFARLFLLFPEDGVLLHTNHFLSPRFDGKDVSLWVMPDSPFRLERLRTAVADADRPLDLDLFRRVLADHANHPLGVCCHPDPRLEPHEQGATVASVLMDLDGRRMWVADGHPCTTPFRELDYAAFLSKPSPLRTSVPHRAPV
ncbi:MAG TPA: C45 family peptidase [Actinomycetota bacterium]|nr:C45 family peptidase [Actinomycetota bacterium]